jgi:hypothetical protein
LFALPSVGRLLTGMLIARIAQSMVSVTIVLFTLSVYKSAQLAGLAAFFSLFPGLIVSPVAGALLDRHGRTRLVIDRARSGGPHRRHFHRSCRHFWSSRVADCRHIGGSAGGVISYNTGHGAAFTGISHGRRCLVHRLLVLDNMS